MQDADTGEPAELKVVTKRQPTADELVDMTFAFKVAKHVKSNAIVYARGLATVGIGAGHRGKANHTATLYSAGGAISTLNLISEGRPAFHISVIGEKGRIDRTITYDDHTYLSGIRSFCRMFKTGKTDETRESILTPVAVLEAIEKSLKTRKRTKLPSIA